MKRMKSMNRLVYMLEALLLIWGWAASAQVIDFEDLPASEWGGPATVAVTTQYATQGITFSAQSPGIVALDYSNPLFPQLQGFAHSGTKAIETCYGVPFCNHAFSMSFVQPQTRVKVWAGFSGFFLNRTVTVLLRALDLQGAEITRATATLQVGSDPLPIRTPLEVSSAGPHIASVVVNLLNPDGSVADTNFLALDDMQFSAFTPVYAQNAPGNGIGSYNLANPADQVFPFDYDSSGRLDHLVLYRPGTGTIWILRNTAGNFSPVYAQGDPGNGIGGYDLKNPADQIFPFDYDSSGKLDHLVLYRPGTGTIWILKNSGGTFTPVYQQGDPGSGIGGFDLASPADRVFAFDYDGSGKLDHLVLYRPGTGTIWILKNTNGTFTPVYAQGAPGNGIGGFNLASPADQVFAFDYDSSSKLDHLAIYRPGTGTIWILKNSGGTFTPVYAQGDPGHGIGQYDLADPADKAFAFDFDHSYKWDHLALYRPGTGTIWILKNTNGTFTPVYAEGPPGKGIGGYDLASPADRVFPFDFDSSGKSDHLVLYRPGDGAIWILNH